MSVSPTRTQDIRTTPALATGDPNRQSPLTSHSSKALAMDAPKDEQHSPNGVVTDGHSAPTASVPEELAQYKFPDRKLKRVMEDSSKTPLLLVACGSFSPITHLHLRMFEMVADHVRHKTNYEIVGGYLSPVSDAYKKSGLASADHRLHMCEIASEPAPWLMVDPWEALQKEYTRTALVLDHFEREINVIHRGITTKTGERKAVHVALLAGADLIGTMSTPGLWSAKDLNHILGRYGAFIVERLGTDIDEALANLQPWKDNIHVIPQLIHNDVSSTKIRSFLRQDLSVQYLIPAPVIKYIEEHGLYEGENTHRRSRSAHAIAS